jgi:hypothetical protein
MTVCAEHRVRRHHRQQRPRDRRLASIRDGLESTMPGAVRCREELLFSSAILPAALSKMCHGACSPANAGAAARDGLPGLALAGLVGFHGARKCSLGLPPIAERG